jgi:hypothetical protein
MRRLLSFFALVVPLTGCAGTSSSSKSDPITAGQKLYVNKCAKCHKFYDPTKYSDADWNMWMGKMSRKAKLKPEQEQQLSTYIDEKLRGKEPPKR